ncbi:uncharacterized protein LOC112054268 [Bicyclus anynana]|uniref:Uncharacterized protein LOC112054268 n=1 Tax=Bicyclus anynana TaxID=110368 RepID=A0A6J1NPX7_BICAN|nr:uncharacterized protein LOC112054268 [Bicyclus anynana]
METNHLYCTRTGRTTSEKTMEDGNVANAKDDTITTAKLTNLYSDRSCKLTTNGHDLAGEPASPSDKSFALRRTSADTLQDDKFRKRINPLRIHLGKRPFVDNSVPLAVNSVNKKRKSIVNKPSDTSAPRAVPRVPKLIPKRLEHNQFHNVAPHNNHSVVNEQDKPVPRLVPKSQLSQFKKSKMEKTPQLKEYAQSLGLQPMVKFKCRKCCSMSFKTLAMLKEHQLVCRAQAKEPALSPEAAPSTDSNSGGPSRVTRKVYLCSACGTYYENWNLFLHMREVHSRHICLFCLGMFSKAEKLSSHLINKHNVKEFSYNSTEDFCKVYNGSFYLMCCVCDEICSEKDDFFNHDCNNVKPKPVPVLISKNSMKSNNAKLVKNSNDAATNGPLVMTKECIKPLNEQKEFTELKPDTILQSQKIEPNVNICDTVTSNTSTSSESSASTSKDTNQSLDITDDVKCSNNDKIPITPVNEILQPIISVPNGKELSDHSDDSDSPDTSHLQESLSPETSFKQKELPSQPLREEKECGIKLKLSLNNANSPVIINSTVDPTVGQQFTHKPPTRNRRPPKRYEKDKIPATQAKTTPTTPHTKPPSIKITICDKADSPFVKTTIIENDEETVVKTLVNNNIEPIPRLPETKPENAMKSTIYDNKLEDVNTLNRVPKLTVRVPKEFLDKDSSSDYSSDSDAGEKLLADNKDMCIDESIPENKEEPTETIDSVAIEPSKENVTEIKNDSEPTDEGKVEIKEEIQPNPEIKTEPPDITSSEDINVEDPEVNDIIPVTELILDRAIDKYPMKDLLKVFVTSTVFNCIYCNHVRKIAVNCEQLALHMVAEHRFSATVDSITAEELMPETIAAKVKAAAQEVSSIYINLDSYDSVDKCDTVQPNLIFECFQCYFKTAVHKELYFHNRKMHQKTILLCVMCKNNFYSYSELLCHLCPGTYDSECEIRYRCCFCNVDNISSSFRLMVHLRKIHHTCDVCLEFCQSQARLSNHVWKHKLHHLCYRCGIAYRNKPDITNHLFWKHGTESVLCKKCLQKKWPHVYHFCTPPAVFVCDECTLQFTRAVSLKVHKRFHSQEYPHLCTEDECTEKFVSKKLLSKHLDEHRKKLIIEDLDKEETPDKNDLSEENPKEAIPVNDLVLDKPKEEAGSSENKAEAGTEQLSKKGKKKKLKDKDALLLDVNLPALNLSESDSSDESDCGISQVKDENLQDKTKSEPIEPPPDVDEKPAPDMNVDILPAKIEEKLEPTEEDKPSEEKVLEIWDNFKKYQEKVEKQKEKTPPLVPIKKHVCESDHDYCVIPTELNGDDDVYRTDKKKSKRSPKKRHGGLSSSSSSSSDSDSSCSCGSNCSCSSSSGSSSSSSSDSDSSDESGNDKKKKQKKSLSQRRASNGSNVDVMGMAETPLLIPEKTEPPIAESDLETEESDTDEEFYDENPQKMANKMLTEKRNQLLLLASVAPSGGSMSGELSRCTTPVKEEEPKEIKENKVETKEEVETKVKSNSSKKKSKKKKRSKNSRKHGPIKMTIPKDVIAKADAVTPSLMPNKITISLQTNTAQIPEPPTPAAEVSSPNITTTPIQTAENKRASKRRRVPNRFYGYSSDEEAPQTPTTALKPQQPPKLEWRKEDLPSPVTHKSKKEIPSTVVPQRMFNYNEPIRLTTPIPDPEPPRFLMNSESMESSNDSDSSHEGALEIYQPAVQNPIPVPPPTYLNSGTSSLPYSFARRAVRKAREGESVYCYCRCPYDEVSEMIACDAEGCPIEWFHFECVGIMVPPKGKWYCPECRKNQSFSAFR